MSVGDRHAQVHFRKKYVWRAVPGVNQELNLVKLT